MGEELTYDTALDRWYAHIGKSGGAHPRINVWYPCDLPFARLETIDHGCHDAPTLRDPDRIHAYVTVEGITIGGLLDDLELLFAAVGEEIARVRSDADEMIAEGRIGFEPVAAPTPTNEGESRG